MNPNYSDCNKLTQDKRFTSITVSANVEYTQEVCFGNVMSQPTNCHYENRAATGSGSLVLTPLTNKEFYALDPVSPEAHIPPGRFYAGITCSYEAPGNGCGMTTFYIGAISFGDGSWTDSSIQTGGTACTPSTPGVTCTRPTDPGYTVMTASLAVIHDLDHPGRYIIEAFLCSPDYCTNVHVPPCQLVDAATYDGLCDLSGNTGIIYADNLQLSDFLNAEIEGDYEIPDDDCATTTPCDDTHSGNLFDGTSSLTVTFSGVDGGGGGGGSGP